MFFPLTGDLVRDGDDDTHQWLSDKGELRTSSNWQPLHESDLLQLEKLQAASEYFLSLLT